jgi:hypothetical protein
LPVPALNEDQSVQRRMPHVADSGSRRQPLRLATVG